jgi:acetyl esterase/lipase
MQEWLLAHDPVAAALRSPTEFEEFERKVVLPANPMLRPESRRAFDLWRTVLTGEHRSAGWLGERRGYAEFLPRTPPPASPTGPIASVSCDGTPALQVGRPLPDDAPVVLHLHGGGYTMGSAELAAPLAGRLAEAGWPSASPWRCATPANQAAGCPRGSTSCRPSATWRSRWTTWVPPPTPTRGSTASR